MKSVVIYYDTPLLCVKNCELNMKNCKINVNLGVAGVAGATYFLFCNIYARARLHQITQRVGSAVHSLYISLSLHLQHICRHLCLSL